MGPGVDFRDVAVGAKVRMAVDAPVRHPFVDDPVVRDIRDIDVHDELVELVSLIEQPFRFFKVQERTVRAHRAIQNFDIRIERGESAHKGFLPRQSHTLGKTVAEDDDAVAAWDLVNDARRCVPESQFMP